MKNYTYCVILLLLASCAGENNQEDKPKSLDTHSGKTIGNAVPVCTLEVSPMQEEWEEVEEDSADIEVFEPTELSKHFTHPIDDCLQSNKVESLIIPPGKDDDEYAEFASIPAEAFDALNNEEKLIYCLKYPEWFDQVCAESMPYDPKRLKSDLPWDNSGRSMSTRQEGFIKDHPGYVLETITDCIGSSNVISEGYLRLFSWLHYTEYIPQVLEKYKSSKNTNYLTLCMEMMRKDEYPPYFEWIKTTPFNEPEFDVMMAGIELTDEIESSLLKLIKQYYSSENRTDSTI